MMKSPRNIDEVPQSRELSVATPEQVLKCVARHYKVAVSSFKNKGGNPIRDRAALLARRTTSATLRELIPHFGLTHPDSLSNLIRRAEREIVKSAKRRKEIETIKNKIRKTGNRV